MDEILATPDPGGPPLRRFHVEVSVFYPVPVRKVFAVFTLEVDRWWTYRIRDGARSAIEPHAGGRWTQAWENGELLFGHFTLWDPPQHLRLSGPLAMEGFAFNVVDVYFHETPDGTKLELQHVSWGELDPSAAELYEGGWRDLFEGPLREHLARA